jgi:hypothetical protein
MKLARRIAALALAATLAVPCAAADAWETVAERTEFNATSNQAQTLELLRKISDASPAVDLSEFGRSASGRPLSLVVVSKDRAFTPEAVRATGKPVVMIQNAIHGGEVDGKDASLMLLRALARGEHATILDRVILLIVPIYNVDGHENVSPYNRPNQDGPRDGMGFRTTADGHDLNRDHLKLETPEARAMIELFGRYRPHLHIDNHVTNGSDHAWVLTYSWVERPQIAAPIADWLEAHMPGAIARTERADHRVGPYVSLIDSGDPSKGFDTYVGQPRYATGYYPLRNCPSILVENHSYKPYRARVLANLDFMIGILEEVAAEPRALVDAVARAEAATIARGRPDAEASELVLRYGSTPSDETVRFPVYAWSNEPSVVMGVPLTRYERGEIRETEVPWIHRPGVEATTRHPRGYLILPGWPSIEARLAGHGLEVHRLTAPTETVVESFHLSDRRDAPGRGGSYQGLTRIVVDVETHEASRTLPEGTLWIPADQPDFAVAVQLLEPEAVDSLVRWGLLSIVFERKEYIAPRVLEPWVVERLASDPELAEAWRLALEDEAFASNPWARWEWWYRKTEHWDDTVGLLPYFRVQSVPGVGMEPWPAP